MIEILLPKAMHKMSVNEVLAGDFEKARKFKLVEMWSPEATPRKGWIKVCKKTQEATDATPQ